METDVEFDEQLRAEAAPIEFGGEPLGGCETVDGHRQRDAFGCYVGETAPLVGPERGVVHENRRGARLLEHFGLARLRDRQPAGAELELTQPDLRRLVRLGVGPERYAVRIDVRLQLSKVDIQPIEVDHRRGRLDLAETTTDLASEQLERPIRS